MLHFHFYIKWLDYNNLCHFYLATYPIKTRAANIRQTHWNRPYALPPFEPG